MTATLYKIAKQFNKTGITWALGGRAVLVEHGIFDQANEIDLLVMQKDLVKVNKVLSSLGVKKQALSSKKYLTKHFYQYEIDEVEVTVICELQIKYEDTTYPYLFDQSSITSSAFVARIKTFYTSLEDWYVLYTLMQDQDEYVAEIEKYFILHHIKNIDLLNRTLELVPHDLKLEIKYKLKL